MKRYVMSLVIRELQIKTTVRYHYTLSKKKKKKCLVWVLVRMWRNDLSYTVGRSINLQSLWKRVWQFL